MPLVSDDPHRPAERVLRQLASAVIYERLADVAVEKAGRDTCFSWTVLGRLWRARGRIGPFGRPRLSTGSVEMAGRRGWTAGDPVELARALGEGTGAGERFAAEIAATARGGWSLAAGRGNRRSLGFTELEGALDEGHPYHPSFRALTGFTSEDRARYGQGAPAFRLFWLLVHKSRLTLSGGAREDGFWEDAIGPDGFRAAREAAVRQGWAMSEIGLLPVHPHQWPRLEAQLAAGDRRHVQPLGQIGDRYVAGQSLRSVFNADRPGADSIKLPIDVTNTSVRRTLPPHTVAAGPALSAWLKEIVEGDAAFRTRYPLALLEEHAGVIFDRDQPLAELTAALWRRNVDACLGPGECALPFTSLIVTEADGRPFVDDFVRQHGLARWLDRLIDVAVLPLWHLLVAHGIATEAHGQNLILVHRDGWPSRIVLRDLHDSVEYVRDFLREGQEPPDFESLDPQFRDPTPDLYYWMQSDEDLRWLLMDTLFVVNLTEVSHLVETAYGLPETAFWNRVRRKIARHAEVDGLRSRLARLRHDAAEVQVERLVWRKLHPGDPDGASAPPAHLVPNPLRTTKGSDGMIDIDGRRYEVAELAGRLGELGGGAPLKPDDGQSYAVCHPDPAVWLGAFFAVREAGASVVPVHPASPPEAARRTAVAAGCTHLVYGETIEVMPEAERQLGGGRLVQMTSGTTGAPKPIARAYEEIEDEIASYVEAFSAPDGMTPVIAAPTSHSYGLICGLLAGLKRGATPVVVRPDNPRQLLRRLAEIERPVLYASPAVLHTLAQLLPEDRPIHAAMTSGALLPEAWFRPIRSRVTRLFQQYGTSETGVIAVNEQTEDPRHMGQVLPHHRLLDDGRADAPVEIRVETPWRTVDTRDLGYRAAGNLVFVARLDDTINVAGLNVYPGEVEDVAMAMPGVADAVAFRVADPFAGERVALIYAAASDIAERELLAWCADRLAGHQLPVTATRVARVPRLGNGKVNRREVAECFAAGTLESV